MGLIEEAKPEQTCMFFRTTNFDDAGPHRFFCETCNATIERRPIIEIADERNAVESIIKQFASGEIGDPTNEYWTNSDANLVAHMAYRAGLSAHQDLRLLREGSERASRGDKGGRDMTPERLMAKRYLYSDGIGPDIPWLRTQELELAVAAAVAVAVAEAVREERERCAKVCDEMERECAISSEQDRESGYYDDAEHWEIKAGLSKRLAAAIREGTDAKGGQ